MWTSVKKNQCAWHLLLSDGDLFTWKSEFCDPTYLGTYIPCM